MPSDQKLTWSVNDPQVAAVLDAVTVDELLTLKFQTSPRQPRRAKDWAALLGHALQALTDGIDLQRTAAVASQAGSGACAQRGARLRQDRAAKLLHLLPVLVFGKQCPGRGLQFDARLNAVLTGDLSSVVQSALSFAHKGHARTGAAVGLSEAGADFSVRDRALHDLGASLSWRRGGITKAAQLFTNNEGHAPADVTAREALQSKHPAPGERTDRVTDTPLATVRNLAAAAITRFTSAPNAATIRLNESDVLHALHQTKSGKAAGLDGLLNEHLFAALGPMAQYRTSDGSEFDVNGADLPVFVTQFTKLCNVLLAEPELVSDDAMRLWRASSLSAIGAKRRPIACSGVLRRLMSSAVARKVRDDLAPQLTALSQYGVGVSSGVEHVAMQTRLWHELGGTVLHLDCSNAFNSVVR